MHTLFWNSFENMTFICLCLVRVYLVFEFSIKMIKPKNANEKGIQSLRSFNKEQLGHSDKFLLLCPQIDFHL